MLAAEIRGQDQLEAKIAGLTKAFDTRDVLDESAAILLNSIRNRFLRGVDTEGQPWTVSYAAVARAKSGRGGGTLFDTGRLFHSLQEFVVDDQSRAIGTDVPYARKHQMGEEGMIRREFLGFSQPNLDTIRAMLVRRAAEALGG